jgi:CubicO group peptidase (beta-lactamase class C family)
MSFSRLISSSVLLLSLSVASLFSWADAPANSQAFIETTPEAEGVPSAAIQKLTDSLDKNIQSVHSFVLLRHGHKIAEAWWAPYRKTEVHQLWSLSKSFTSAAIGFAVAEKRLSINDKDAMRIKDLLTMSTGHERDAFDDMFVEPNGKMLHSFFNQTIQHKPGTLFMYNTGATYTLAAILQKVTGQKLVDYLTPRLFEPLGIRQHPWERSKEGIDYGGFGLYLTTEDIAKFGQLYLNKGVWNGKQIIPAEWVEQSTSKQVSNGSDPESFWDQGYGFQFWRNVAYGYRADGAFGQFCIVLPEFDLVLAMNSGSSDMPGILATVWKELIPWLRASPLPEAPAAQAALRKQLSQLMLPVVAGKNSSPLTKHWSGKSADFLPNPVGIKAVSFEFGKDSSRVTFAREGLIASLDAGYGRWLDGVSALDAYLGTDVTAVPQDIASSSAWVAKDHFQMKIVSRHNQHTLTLNFRFNKDEVTLDGERNVDFAERKLPVITGKLVP